MQAHRYDPYEVDQASRLQQHFPRWCIMWRLWARTFTAWHLADPRECRTVEATTPGELRDLIVNAELELWRASPAAHPARSSPVLRRPPGEARQAQPSASSGAPHLNAAMRPRTAH